MATNINQTLEDLIAALGAVSGKEADCCQAKGGKVEVAPSDKQPEYGETESQFQTSEEYFSARCNAANGVYDTIKETVVWLDDNNVDLKAGLFGGLTTGLVVALLASGPAGWAIAAGGGLVVALATWIVAETLDFEDMSDALDTEHDDLIAALYTANSASMAKLAFLAVIDAGAVSLSAAERFLLSLMLPFSLLNQILEPREDMATYQSPDPVVCSGAVLLEWSFEASAESWTFRDESTANATASVEHSPANESLKSFHEIIAGGTGRITRGVNVSPTIAQVVTPGNIVIIDHSGTSDGIVVFRTLKLIYDDAREFTQNKPGHSSAGSITIAVTESGTIETIELLTGRSNGGAPTGFVFTTDTLEVRIE